MSTIVTNWEARTTSMATPTSIPVFPPDLSLPFPRLLDFHRKHNPDHVYAMWLSSKTGTVEKVSWREMGRAMHRIAHVVRPGRTGEDGRVVAIIANTDTLLYVAIHLGLMKAGYVPFPISPRNSVPAIANLLKKTNCHHVVTNLTTLGPLVAAAATQLKAEDHEVSIDDIPSLQTAFPLLSNEKQEDPFQEYPEPEHFDVNDVALYLHSSGTTSLPKPIAQSHARMTDWCRLSAIYDSAHRWKDWSRPFGAMAVPPFHTMGIIGLLSMPFVAGIPVALFEPMYPAPPITPTPVTTLKAMEGTNSLILFLVPVFLEVWANQPAAVDYLVTTDQIWFGGGPLSDDIGKFLVSKGCNIYSFWGTTETGVTSLAYTEGRKGPLEYGWFEHDPRCKFVYEERGEGLYELIFTPSEIHKPSVINLPEIQGYATGDLWKPHPTNPNLWKIVGRTDDLIVLSTGEKMLPILTEGALVASPYVNGVALFGRQRPQIGVLIEPRSEHAVDLTDANAVAALRDAIWPTLEAANSLAPEFGRVVKEMIVFTSPEKPMMRAVKGNVMRQATINLYQKEIDDAYVALERGTAGQDVTVPSSWTDADVRSWLWEYIAETQPGVSLPEDSDLFALGFDSLSATTLRSRIINALRTSGHDDVTTSITSTWVYERPTINQIVHGLVNLVSSMSEAASHSKAIAMADMVKKYTADLPSAAESGKAREGKHVVLLTGSTGGLGSQILSILVEDKRVDKIYALNRPSSKASVYERQKIAFEERKLSLAALESETLKVTYLEGDLAAEHLGLDTNVFREVQSSATIIIHSAGILNFNYSLSSFESQVRGTHNLAKLALSSLNARQIRFLYTSSISVSRNWTDGQDFPESVLSLEEAGWSKDDSQWQGSGYGESKFVAEQVLARASELGLHTTSFRIGQISGSEDAGAWTTTDWVPILAKSSLKIGLPKLNGVVSWLPVNVVAQSILDVAFNDGSFEPALNLVHTSPVPWNAVMSWLADAMKDAGLGAVPLVPYSEWIQALEARSHSPSQADISDVPAIKLLDFFHSFRDQTSAEGVHEAGGAATMSTEKAQAVSDALRSASPLSNEAVASWVGYWKSKELF